MIARVGQNIIPAFSIPNQTNFDRLKKEEIIEDGQPLLSNADVDIISDGLHNNFSFISATLSLGKKIESAIPDLIMSDERKSEISTYVMKYIYMALATGKSSINQDDCQLIMNQSLPSASESVKKKISRIIQSSYEHFVNIKYLANQENRIEEIFRSPNIAPHKMNFSETYGFGSYSRNGKWVYGKTILPDLPSVLSKKTGKNNVASCNINVSLEKTVLNSNYYTIEGIFQSISADKNHLFDMTGRRKLQMAVLQNIVVGKDKWHSIIHNGKTHKKLELNYKNNQDIETSPTWFEIIHKSYDENSSKGTMEIINAQREKIGHIDNTEPESHVACRFVAMYVASEIAATIYAIGNSLHLPHKGSVPPNASPWIIRRLSGSIMRSPYSSYGQFSIPQRIISEDEKSSVNWLSEPASQSPDFPEKSLEDTIPEIWENFVNDVKSVRLSESMIRLYNPNYQFFVEAKIDEQNITTIFVYSEDKFLIDTKSIVHEKEDEPDFPAKIAFGHACEIYETPSYESKGYKMLVPPWKHSDDYQTTSDPSLELMKNSIISYVTDHRSFVQWKTSDQRRLRGDLTASIKIFKKPELNPEKYPSFSSPEEFLQKCVDYYSSNIFIEKDRVLSELITEIDKKTIINRIMEFTNNSILHLAALKAEEEESVFMARNKSIKNSIFCFSLQNQKYNLSYEVYLMKKQKPMLVNIRDPYKIVDDSFSSLYSFYINCKNSQGDVLCVYMPSFDNAMGIIPRHEPLFDIFCGYLPDFILWMNKEGVQDMYLENIQSSFMHNKREKARILKDEQEMLPFSVDATMSLEQFPLARQWLVAQFPSLFKMQQSIAHKDNDVLNHIMDSVRLVDTTRIDGYCPSIQLNNEEDSSLLRLTMLLHDIGKCDRTDHGDGGLNSNHARISASLAQRLLDAFYLSKKDKARVIKYIQHHDLIGSAQNGKFGTLEQSITHVAKISETIGDLEMFYNIFRCDVDAIPCYGEMGQEFGISISPKTGCNPRQFVDLVKNFIENSKFSSISQNVPSGEKKLVPAGEIWNFSENAELHGERALKAIRLSTKKLFCPTPYNTSSYNPQYSKKFSDIMDEIINNPHLSYAKELGMSYQGITGTVIRCFLWTISSMVQPLFQDGSLPYFGIDGRCIIASVNKPAKSPVFPNSETTHALVVFDYHMGHHVSRSELVSIANKWKNHKRYKLGATMFSLNYDENDSIDYSKIALDLGISSLIFKHREDTYVSCLDPKRIALLSAFEFPAKSYGKYEIGHILQKPMQFTSIQSSGFQRTIELPKMHDSEIHLSEDNKMFWS